jgi:hypothetical protein
MVFRRAGGRSAGSIPHEARTDAQCGQVRRTLGRLRLVHVIRHRAAVVDLPGRLSDSRLDRRSSLARRFYRFRIWTSTLGEEPPGKDKMDGRTAASDKKPLFVRVRPYSPPGWIERREKPVPMPVRVVWSVIAGWWLGAVWVVISWSPFLLPYPLFDTVAALLGEVPSVMTLAWPESVARPASSA